MKRHELAGKRFGAWTVLEYVGDSYWKVQCDCGSIAERDAYSLEQGLSLGCKRCRHHRDELLHTPEHHVWKDLFDRCYNPNERGFKNYGGRGIKVCERWHGKDGFRNFLEDMGKRPSKHHQLDRIDNDTSYSPENCRWATRKENNRNRGDNRIIEMDGEKKCLTEWCEIYNIRKDCVAGRLARGWSVDEAFKKPINEKVWAKRRKGEKKKND